MIATPIDRFAIVHKRDLNGSPYTEELLGHVIVGAGVSRTTQYECAAWYTTIAVTPGTYDVILHRHGTMKWVLFALPGIVTSASFQALYAGAPISETRDTGADYIGTPHTYRGQIYDYVFADCAKHGKRTATEDVTFELTNPRFTLTPHTFDNGGTPHTMTRLIANSSSPKHH